MAASPSVELRRDSSTPIDFDTAVQQLEKTFDWLNGFFLNGRVELTAREKKILQNVATLLRIFKENQYALTSFFNKEYIDPGVGLMGLLFTRQGNFLRSNVQYALFFVLLQVLSLVEQKQINLGIALSTLMSFYKKPVAQSSTQPGAPSDTPPSTQPDTQDNIITAFKNDIETLLRPFDVDKDNLVILENSTQKFSELRTAIESLESSESFDEASLNNIVVELHRYISVILGINLEMIFLMAQKESTLLGFSGLFFLDVFQKLPPILESIEKLKSQHPTLGSIEQSLRSIYENKDIHAAAQSILTYALQRQFYEFYGACGGRAHLLIHQSQLRNLLEEYKPPQSSSIFFGLGASSRTPAEIEEITNTLDDMKKTIVDFLNATQDITTPPLVGQKFITCERGAVLSFHLRNLQETLQKVEAFKERLRTIDTKRSGGVETSKEWVLLQHIEGKISVFFDELKAASAGFFEEFEKNNHEIITALGDTKYQTLLKEIHAQWIPFIDASAPATSTPGLTR